MDRVFKVPLSPMPDQMESLKGFLHHYSLSYVNQNTRNASLGNRGLRASTMQKCVARARTYIYIFFVLFVDTRNTIKTGEKEEIVIQKLFTEM